MNQPIKIDKNHRHTVQALALCLSENIPVVLWGSPGTGKTTSINKIAKAHNLHLETVIASIREPSDFFGLPYFENGYTRSAAPIWVGNVLNKKNNENITSIVFYDEISTAPPATQAALLRPILEGYVGDTKLPDGTRTVAAANPPNIAADGWEMSPPAANRFVHLEWEPSPQDISRGFLEGWENIRIPAPGDKESRSKALKLAKRNVGEFLARRPKYALQLPNDNSLSEEDFSAYDYAFPTPRSWEMAAKLYAASMTSYIPLDNNKKQGINQSVFITLLNGCVGTNAAFEFLTYIKSLDIMSADEVLSDPYNCDIPDRGDKLEALLSALDNQADYKNIEEYDAVATYVSRLIKEGKGEASIILLKKLVEERPKDHLWPAEAHEILSGLAKRIKAF